MRTVVIGIAVLAVGALVFGGFLIASDSSPFSGTVQVTNPEGSAIVATDSQFTWLAIAFAVIISGVVGTGLGITGLVWLLSREVKKAEETEPAPVIFSLTSGEENSLGTIAVQNAVPLLITLTAGLVIIFVLIVLVSGAL